MGSCLHYWILVTFVGGSHIFSAVARSGEPKYNIAPIAGIAEPITHQWLRHATEMQQSTCILLYFFACETFNLRDLLTWFYVIFRGTHELSWYSYWRMHLFHSFSDVDPCRAMSSGLGESMSVASMTGTGGTLAEKTLELRRDGVVPVSSKDAFGTSKE